MAGSAGYSAQLLTSGGFRIEIGPDGLTVTEDSSTRTRFSIYLTYTVVFCYLLVSARRSLVIFLLVLLAAGLLRYLFIGVHNLRGTHENLEVIDLFRGRTKRSAVRSRGLPLAQFLFRGMDPSVV
jgi:hypothetical protein